MQEVLTNVTEHPVFIEVPDSDADVRPPLPLCLRDEPPVVCRAERPGRVLNMGGCALAYATRDDLHCVSGMCERGSIAG